MADEKKPEKPEKAEAKVPSSFWSDLFSHPDPFVETVWAIAIILLLLLLLNALTSLLSRFGFVDWLAWLLWLFNLIKWWIWLLCLLLIAWIIYLNRELGKLRREEARLLYPEAPVEKEVNPQWQRILTHVESVHENDRRLAILEADIILNELLDKMSLPGETIGDKLKAVEKSHFTTIDNAWEAHKIRNQIAHQGEAFLINQREAKRVIELYRSVFEEFQII